MIKIKKKKKQETRIKIKQFKNSKEIWYKKNYKN